MTSIIVDASAMAPFMLADEAGEKSSRLLDVLTGVGVLAPHHWRLEVANLGRKAVRDKRITRQELDEAVELLNRFRVTIDDQGERYVWGRTLEIASDHDLTSYDAAYLELALRKGAVLASHDRALLETAPKIGVGLFAL